MTTEVNNDLSLEEQISAFRQQMAGKALPNPTAAALRAQNLERLIQSKAAEKSVQSGEPAPDFSLPDVDGSTVNLRTLLQHGPVVVTFYRGDWCPFCNLALRAYEHILPQIKAFGGSLVAISPQTPDYSILTAQHKELTYPVLSDVGNHVARSYGLVYTLPEALHPFSVNLEQFNGDTSWELPMVATYVIAANGLVKLAAVNPDHTKRLEPTAILDALQSLVVS